MKIGAVFPQTEIGNDPAVILDWAQSVEAMGYAHALVYDHVLGAHRDRFQQGFTPPYTHQTPFHEPFVLFGFLAAATRTLGLTSGIIILPQRQTALVAKQAAAADVLSGGRLRLGVGIGWNPFEFEALNENFRNRARRVEEQIDVMRRLWTDELVDFQGRWHTIKQVGINPLPVQRPIPLWMGAMAEPAVRRAARIADGWFPQFAPGPRLAETIAMVREEVRASGRRPEDFGIEGRISASNTAEDAWASTLEAWRDLGASDVSFNTMNAGLASPREHIDTLRRFAKAAGLRA